VGPLEVIGFGRYHGGVGGAAIMQSVLLRRIENRAFSLDPVRTQHGCGHMQTRRRDHTRN